ncbi:MAG: TIGR04283 family arsenosugar biosynthesis glycosyltransferase [Pseudomonadota bacterium]
MRAPISIIIPTLNAAAGLPGCLTALMEGLEGSLIRELIVVDGGSDDDTQAIAKAWGAELIVTAPSRGGQLRTGCAAARGDWLLVLHADTQLSPGWSGPARAHMATGQAGWFQLAFDSGGRAVAGWANLRSRMLGLPYGDQGLLLPRALYAHAGGYPDQPLMEDVALARALKGHLRPVGAVAVTSAARYRRAGWLRRGARNLLTLARYFAGTDPEVLARAYRR